MKQVIYILIIGFVLTTYNSCFSHVQPSGGKTHIACVTNSSFEISWNKNLFTQNVDIYLWNAMTSSYTLIADDVTNTTGSYIWSVPLSQPTGDYFRIRISGAVNDKVYFMSKTFFSILEGSSNTNKLIENELSDNGIVIAPNPSNSLTRIFWKDKNIEKIDIISLDGNVVMTFNVKVLNEIYVNSSMLSSGKYIVNFSGKNANYSEGLVIRR